MVSDVQKQKIVIFISYNGDRDLDAGCAARSSNFFKEELDAT